jgi:hypothetical protein
MFVIISKNVRLSSITFHCCKSYVVLFSQITNTLRHRMKEVHFNLQFMTAYNGFQLISIFRANKLYPLNRQPEKKSWNCLKDIV